MKDLTKKFKKSDDGDIEEVLDAEDATGDIDISALEQEVTKTEFRTLPEADIDTGVHNSFESSLEDLEDEEDSIDLEEEFPEDEQFDDEQLEDEIEEEQSPVLKFLQSQLPFVYNLVNKAKSSKVDKKKEKKSSKDKNEIDDDELDDDNAPQSFIEKQLPFLAKFTKKNKKTDQESDEEDEDLEDGEEVPKKKRKLNVIQLLIIIAVVFVGLEFLFPEEEPVAIPVLKKRPRPVPQVQQPVEPAPVPAPEPEPTAPSEVVDTTDSPNPQVDSPVENIPVEEPMVDPVGETIGEEPVEPVSETVDTPTNTEEDLGELFDESNQPVSDVDDPQTTDEDEPETTPAPEPVELPVVDEDPNFIDDEETDVPTTPKPLEQPSDDEIFNDGIIDEVVDTSVSPNITDSILKSLEEKINSKKEAQVLVIAVKPTNPPEYDFLGRGLVYNCTGKHWACIDSVSFTKCGENFSWNTKSSNAIECYPSELYDSVEDCTVVQQFKIDNVAETKFCGP